MDASVIEMCVQELRTPLALSSAVEHIQAQASTWDQPLFCIMDFFALWAKQQILSRSRLKKRMGISQYMRDTGCFLNKVT